MRAGLPVPAIDGIVGVDGRRGIIFERIEGTSMADLIMDAMASTRDGHLQYAEMLAELHASIHSREGHDLPSLRAMVEGGIRQATTLSDELRMRALHVLDQIRDGTGLCHYDFHPLNVIVSPRGPVIIDWMTASQGDPHADIARTLLLLRSAQAPQTLIDRFIACYLKCYSEKRPVSLDEVRAWRVLVAAARLNENIPREKEWLLRIVREELALFMRSHKGHAASSVK